MKTQMEYAREGIITSKMQQAADNACIAPELLRDKIALHPALARKRRGSTKETTDKHGACTMCGELCAYKVMSKRKEAA